MSTQLKCPQCGTALPSGALEGLCPACLLKQGTTADSATQGGSAPFEALPVAEVAKLFPQLEIVELIGKGGMGAIYKARQPALDRLVALKLLPPPKPGGPDFAERFNREARALARLNHPNIVAVHEFGQVNGLHYFLMEFVDGVNLRQLERAGQLSPREALQIVPQICDALQYAHDEGVVHRDIKPENVLVDRKGRVKIADFGLAKILGLEPNASRLTGEGQVMGTPHYMAPEQIERPLEVDHRADIYALGVVFYEMLTGELPLGRFAAPSRKVQVDVRLDEVVLRALEKEPERRFQQASQVKTAVETIASTAEPPPPAAPSVAAPPQDWWERMKMRLWPPLVGRRGGQRMINWPAMAMRAARALMIAFCLGIIFGICVGVLLSPRAGLLFGAGEFIVICGLAGFILTIRVLRGFAVPLSSLPELDPVTPGVRAPEAPPLVARRHGAKAAAIAGALVFLLVFGAAALITFILPESYVSTARIRVEKAAPDLPPGQTPEFSAYDPFFLQTEFKNIQSQLVLGRVIERLNLGERWARRYRTQGLPNSMILPLLQKQLDVRQSRNTALIEIRVFSEDRFEAAEIANAIVESYRSAKPRNRVEVVDRAEPAWRPARPNKPLNLFLGAIAGLMLGGCAGGMVLLFKWPRLTPAAARLKEGRSRTAGWIALGLVAVVALLAAVGLHSCQGSATQPNVIATGIVTDAATGQPIIHARVADNRYNTAPDRPPQETWTDEKGHFELATWYEEHSIAASAPGYAPSLATLTTKVWSHEPSVHMDFRLTPAASVGAPGQAQGLIEPVDSANSPQAAKPVSATVLAEAPKLRFIARQTADPELQISDVWRPDGKPLEGADEFRLLQQIGRQRLDLTALEGGAKAPVFCFWFSHPALDLRSDCSLSLTDTNGQPISIFHGSVSASLREPEDSPDGNGWYRGNFAAAPELALPPVANVLLAYSLGPWTSKQTIVIKTNEQQQISTEGGQITGLGETLEGRAFIGLARVPSRRDGVQVDFEVETRNGERLDPVGTSSGGTDQLRSEQFEFKVPIREVRAFRLRTRPIKTVEYRNVSLRPSQKAGVEHD